MKARFCPPLLLAFVVGCATKFRPTSLPAATTADAETTRHIDRIEHGLFTGTRIAGEQGLSLDERMKARHVPGFSIAVIRNFKIVWAKAYGFADVDEKRAVTETTLFQAGSISKPVFATAAMKLVQDGRVSLDASINSVLTSWHLPDNDLTRAAPVTLRMLLSHTGGTTVHGFDGYVAGAPVPTLVQVLDGISPANSPPVRVDLAPGTRFRYSGGGTTIAQQALIDVSHKPFDRLLADTVFAPLAMTHSTYAQPLSQSLVADAAVGHDAAGAAIAGKRNVYPEMAAAGLWTTPSDLARFGIEVARAYSGQPSSVISQTTARTMLTKVAATRNPDSDIGIGFFLTRYDGVTYFGHGGTDEGFQAELRMNAQSGDGIAMMANSDQGDALMREVLPAVAAEYEWPGFPPPAASTTVSHAHLRELAGSYQVDADTILRVALDGDHLELRRPFFTPTALVPIADSTFVSRDDPARFIFSKATDGAWQVEVVQPGAAPSSSAIAKRVADSATVILDDLAAGHVDHAITSYRDAIAREPHNLAFSEKHFSDLGMAALFGRSDTATAITLYKLIVALYPDSMGAHFNLANAYDRAGDTHGTIEACYATLAAEARDKVISPDGAKTLREITLQVMKRFGVSPDPASSKAL